MYLRRSLRDTDVVSSLSGKEPQEGEHDEIAPARQQRRRDPESSLWRWGPRPLMFEPWFERLSLTGAN
jgi:hypothetical protein